MTSQIEFPSSIGIKSGMESPRTPIPHKVVHVVKLEYYYGHNNHFIGIYYGDGIVYYTNLLSYFSVHEEFRRSILCVALCVDGTTIGQLGITMCDALTLCGPNPSYCTHTRAAALGRIAGKIVARKYPKDKDPNDSAAQKQVVGFGDNIYDIITHVNSLTAYNETLDIGDVTGTRGIYVLGIGKNTAEYGCTDDLGATLIAKFREFRALDIEPTILFTYQLDTTEMASRVIKLIDVFVEQYQIGWSDPVLGKFINTCAWEQKENVIARYCRAVESV